MNIGRSNHGKNITPRERLLSFLLKMGDDMGDSQNEGWCEISKSRIHDNTNVVLTAMKEKFIEKYITPNPSLQDCVTEARLFNRRTGFPTMIFAALDGTHVKVCF